MLGDLCAIDVHEIHLKNEPQMDASNKLYFVNLGGYDSNEFTELHKNVFVVAENESKAKVKALKQVLDWESHHRDYQFDVENIINIEKATINAQNIHIHLTPSVEIIPFEFTCKYIPIGKD